jgi:hypothetical protein
MWVRKLLQELGFPSPKMAISLSLQIQCSMH